MDRGNILSGAAFRAAFYGTLALVMALFVLGVMSHAYLKEHLKRDLETQILSTVAAIRTAYDDGGMDELVETVIRLSPYFQRTHHVVALYDGNGGKVAGLQDIPPDFLGWTTQEVRDAGGPEPQTYHLIAVEIADRKLIVGRDVRFINSVEAAMVRALLGLGGVMTLVSIGIGYGLSRLTQIKLEKVGNTLEEVSQGDMCARIALSPANDQIDRISRIMNRHLDRLSNLMMASKTSAAGIAHDLKRPLSRAILGLDKALVLSDRGASPVDLIERSRDELSRLTGTFETILRIAWIDTNESNLQQGRVDLTAVLADMGETYAVVAEESGQSLHVAPGSDAPLCVPGDAGMIAQLIVNLLQNAVSHGAEGNEITLSLSRDAGGARIEVADRGPGIAPEDREKVLTAFYRCDAARATEGNGLGLALVKSIADRHGARLTLSDNLPGLRVAIWFPRVLTT